jgi:two-component system, NarL family, nitrate/nitrite response regulator NarL
MTHPKNILICDDHALFSSGIVQILNRANKGYEIRTVTSSDECKIYLSKNQVDVFICDLNIDKQDGFVLLEEMKRYLENTFVIILSAYHEKYLIEKAEKLGVNAYLKKDTSADELLAVIELDRKSPFYYQKSLYELQNQFIDKDIQTVKKFHLTRQEKEIIKYVVDGKNSQEIGDTLFISKNTVDTHRRNIYRKLEVDSLGSLIKYAHENNLLD